MKIKTISHQESIVMELAVWTLIIVAMFLSYVAFF